MFEGLGALFLSCSRLLPVCFGERDLNFGPKFQAFSKDDHIFRIFFSKFSECQGGETRALSCQVGEDQSRTSGLCSGIHGRAHPEMGFLWYFPVVLLAKDVQWMLENTDFLSGIKMAIGRSNLGKIDFSSQEMPQMDASQLPGLAA